MLTKTKVQFKNKKHYNKKSKQNSLQTTVKDV